MFIRRECEVSRRGTKKKHMKSENAGTEMHVYENYSFGTAGGHCPTFVTK